MYATVAEIKAILPAGSLTDDEIQDLLDVSATYTGDNYNHHLNKTVKLAVTKLKMSGLMPDSATVGPLKSDNNVLKALEAFSGTDYENRLPFLYYKKVGNNENQ